MQGDEPEAVASPLHVEDVHFVGKAQLRLQRVALVACLLVAGALVYAKVSTPVQQRITIADQNTVSLNEVPEVTNLGKGHKGCKDASAALRKVLDLERLHKKAGHAGQTEEAAAKDILHGVQSAKVLHEIEDVVSHSTLDEALKLGEVITEDDMNQLVTCELGETTPVHLEEDDEALEGDMLSADDEGRRRLQERILAGKRWAGSLWKEGDIKYCFVNGVNPAAKEAFQASVKHIMDQVPCLHFTEIATKSDTECAEFPSIILKSPAKKSCNSYVGCVGWTHQSQMVNLGQGCESLGTGAHEIGHALGMTHEQSRSDRRKSVVVHYSRIRAGKEKNFRMRQDAYTGTPYDVLSLMHYGSHYFSKDGQRTLEPTNQALANFIGQRLGFSELDIEQLGEMYGCKATVTPLNKNKETSLGYANMAKPAYAPFTKAGCLCKKDWNACATSENGYCATPQGHNAHSGGPWCETEGTCEGETWDRCTPREAIVEDDPFPYNVIHTVGGAFNGAKNWVTNLL